MIDKVKELRVKLDGLTQLTRDLRPVFNRTGPLVVGGKSNGHYSNTREISLAITSLELSKMWLGKCLKEMGNANPYPESKNPSNEKIEPTADTDDKLNWVNDEWTKQCLPNTNLTHIQKVKWLRSELETVETILRFNIAAELPGMTVIGHRGFEESILECIKAGMWLGMELGRVRDLKTEENG
jgi:hypothetical protein